MKKRNKNKEKVYSVVSEISEGRVMTYGEVAKKAGLKSPRTVGMYLHKNTNPEKIPCHRVVFADGSLSPSYAFGGLKAQKRKLESEGVRFHGEKVVLSSAS